MKNRDFEAQIDAALDAGDMDRCAELMATAHALALSRHEDENAPDAPVEFAAIRPHLPIQRKPSMNSGWLRRRRWTLALALATVVGMLSLRIIERPPSGIKGEEIDGLAASCVPVRLRISKEDGTSLSSHTIPPNTRIRIHSISGCPSSAHAVELSSGRWMPIEGDTIALEPGIWALALIATPAEHPSPPSRTQVIAALQAVGNGIAPTIEGKTAFVDVYRLEVR
ncbi:MAG: hypothetical protein IPK13_05860 [Deltaproteobacteria bacterium]|nr:hypothetical protein [Deltaproteobacteria bacterium]